MDRRGRDWHNSGMATNDSDDSAALRSPQTSLTVKGAHTRQRIVTAAAELMFLNGVAGTTLDDVRAAAAVSSSQLYHYFSDKRDLIRAVVAHQTDSIIGGQARANLETLDGFRSWRDEIVDYHRRLYGRGGCPLGSLGSQLAETDPDIRVEVAAGFDCWEATIRDGLRAMHARGGLAPETDLDALALATLAALQGGLLLAQIQRDTRPLEVALDTMIQLIGLLAEPQSARREATLTPV